MLLLEAKDVGFIWLDTRLDADRLLDASCVVLVGRYVDEGFVKVYEFCINILVTVPSGGLTVLGIDFDCVMYPVPGQDLSAAENLLICGNYSNGAKLAPRADLLLLVIVDQARVTEHVRPGIASIIRVSWHWLF